ncbi:TRAP transporter small permease [Sedimenticola hydrogenitrophicus]|uniref:TRAP transporter small permease n=1 Tax=Sedimenticola hydrogenitrophicus TaxID=2967975 RepID=UPI0021A2E30E|nr:TRAP transporter small permease [Sedimenticola hydrogenitrophicus]
MSSASADTIRPGFPGRILHTLCNLFATGGGLVLLGLAVMTVASIVGRYLFSLPVPGDFELVEIGCAIAVFAFLPYCQLHNGNVVVDFFTLHIHPRTRGRMDSVGSLVFGLIAALLTWRLALGGYDMYRYGEQTMILGLSRWWGFIPIVASLALLTLVCFYTCARQWSNRTL